MNEQTAVPEMSRPDVATSSGWVVLGQLFSIAVFAQSLFAGLMLSGQAWGRAVHSFTAYSLVVAVPIAGLAAAVMLHHRPGGRRLTGLLLALAVGLSVQTALGILSAGGMRLLWAHIPVGVAMVGLAAELPGAARALSAAQLPQPTAQRLGADAVRGNLTKSSQ